MSSSESVADPHLSDTHPHDWKYVAEGGSTIVFSYAGPPHVHFDGTALRLRKGPVPALEESDNHDELAPPPFDEPDDPTIVFQRTVVERLVPSEFLPRLDAVRVESAWLRELRGLVEPLRPLERRQRDRIDVGKTKAVLATDLVGGKGWAVEIKPKWGFLPAPTHLSDDTRAIKTRTCRFCMHTHLKASQGASDVSLGYCPLDLFSGDRARVTRALHTLWAIWLDTGAAVNNLRVFVGGRQLKPVAADATASLAPLADQLFPAESDQDSPAHTPTELRDAFTHALLPLLLGTPVLRTLSTLQRTLDALDVEGLAALWAALRPAGHKLGQGEAEPDMAEWTAFVDVYLARYGPPLPSTSDPNPNSSERGETTRTEEELRFQMAAYLLSASFKDCSVILRMPPPPPPRTVASSGDEEGVRGRVTVIDLDVKSIDRLSKWAELDREIVDAYRRDVAEPRLCVDAAVGRGGLI
ncbi:inositol-pentakisphosphate 2-kinase [Fomes fomentarius]|nr:inositol-pentakisphosphate 2-kinase [Fomes fomentarius]